MFVSVALAARTFVSPGTYRGTYAKLSSSPLGLITFVSPLTKLGTSFSRSDGTECSVNSQSATVSTVIATANEREQEREDRTASSSDFPTQIESY